MYTYATFCDLVSEFCFRDIFRHSSPAEDFTMCVIVFHIEFCGMECFASYLYHRHLSNLSLRR